MRGCRSSAGVVSLALLIFVPFFTIPAASSGADFVVRCETQTSSTELQCTLAAPTLAAASACKSGGAS